MEEDDDIDINENVKLYETLKRAWNDEKNAPILLKFKSTEVARFQTLLASREREIEEMENSANESGDGNEMLLSAIGREELNRAKYVLRSYLRTRIKKIQQFPVHVLQQWNEKNSEETEETENGLTNNRIIITLHHRTRIITTEEEEEEEARWKNEGTTDDVFRGRPPLRIGTITRTNIFTRRGTWRTGTTRSRKRRKRWTREERRREGEGDEEGT